MNIYLASSWRNEEQPNVLRFLRGLGYAVYDFRHPREGDNGFAWSDIDPDWQSWNADEYRAGLESDLARLGFASDWEAMCKADACVLLLPCGRSAHLEAGYFRGANKKLIIYSPLDVQMEPELMYRMADHIAEGFDELARALLACSTLPSAG